MNKDFNDVQNDLKENSLIDFISLEMVGKVMSKRDKLNISQRELSRLSGVSQKTVSRIENGLDIPDLRTLEKLGKPLGIKLEIKIIEE